MKDYLLCSLLMTLQTYALGRYLKETFPRLLASCDDEKASQGEQVVEF